MTPEVSGVTASEISQPRRFDVLGVRISETNLTEATETVATWLAAGVTEYVCVTNVHVVMESQRDVEYRAIQNRSGLTVPDGRPLVWCGRRVGSKKVGHVRGADLMLTVLERAEREGWRSFFLGGEPGTPELLVESLRYRFPRLAVAGTHSPPFRELTGEEQRAIVSLINESEADLVWVGLAAPKQERWMAQHRGALDAGVLFGVGAAFDFLSGRKRQAPRWMQRAGLEWLFRLGREPRRMWRRYLVNNPLFVARILRQPPSWDPVRPERQRDDPLSGGMR